MDLSHLPEYIYTMPSKKSLRREYGEQWWLAQKVIGKIHLRTLLAERQNHRCAYCGGYTNFVYKKDRPTIEHVLPRVRGGRDHPDDCVMACYRCNSKRKDRVLPEEEMILEWHRSSASTQRSASQGSFTCSGI